MKMVSSVIVLVASVFPLVAGMDKAHTKAPALVAALRRGELGRPASEQLRHPSSTPTGQRGNRHQAQAQTAAAPTPDLVVSAKEDKEEEINDVEPKTPWFLRKCAVNSFEICFGIACVIFCVVLFDTRMKHSSVLLSYALTIRTACILAHTVAQHSHTLHVERHLGSVGIWILGCVVIVVACVSLFFIDMYQVATDETSMEFVDENLMGCMDQCSRGHPAAKTLVDDLVESVTFYVLHVVIMSVVQVSLLAAAKGCGCKGFAHAVLHEVLHAVPLLVVFLIVSFVMFGYNWLSKDDESKDDESKDDESKDVTVHRGAPLLLQLLLRQLPAVSRLLSWASPRAATALPEKPKERKNKVDFRKDCINPSALVVATLFRIALWDSFMHYILSKKGNGRGH